MIRRLTYTIGLLAALPLLFASCDKDELGMEQQPAGAGEKIRFEITVATASAMPSGAQSLPAGGPRTRVSHNGLESAFEAGDQVGLYIVKGSGGLLSSGNWVDNIKMTFDGTGWSYTMPAGKEYYPRDGKKLHFYAYYPYDATLTNPLAISYTAQADQSTQANFSKSDLMTANAPNVAPTSAAVPLTFTHRTVLVEVIPTYSGIYAQAAFDPGMQVYMKCQTQATVNLATGAVAASGAASDIAMRKWGSSCGAIIPPQSIASGTRLFSFTQAGSTLRHTTSAATAFTGGEYRQYAITLKPDPDHAYAIGDVYPYQWFNIGVVFAVSNDGKNGKIVSLREDIRITSAVWGPEGVTTGATGTTDGAANMKTVYEFNGNSFDGYPAFALVHALNPAGTTYTAGAKGVWYLPVPDELMALRGQLSAVNNTLDARGWEVMGDENYYWSSTEDDGNSAWQASFGYSYAGAAAKHTISRVRAVLAF